MTQEGAADPFAAWRGFRDANMDVWSKAMIDFINSDAYAQATGAWLDSYLTASQPLRKMLETTMEQVLTQLNMPTRNDVTRLAERFTNIEMRLDDMDAKIDELQANARKAASAESTGGTPKTREAQSSGPQSAPPGSTGGRSMKGE